MTTIQRKNWPAILFWPAIVSASMLFGQQPVPVALKNDTPRALQHLEKARASAGNQWATAERYFCEAPRTDAADDPPIEPTKIFDNVYAIGNSGTTAYVIATSQGLIMIDALRPEQTQTQLLPGFAKLGLDPAMVKMVLITHGHLDHFGGAGYFQEHFGSHVYVAAEDWNMVEHPRAGKKGPISYELPHRDQVIKEGEPIVLGGEKIIPFPVPPHTVGSMGFIFPVIDRGEMHMAALFGSVLLITVGTTDVGMQQHLAGIAHWKAETEKAKVDVELQNHPLMDDFTVKLAKLKDRKPNDPNPFVVGQAGYQKFVEVMDECMQAEVDRRANR